MTMGWWAGGGPVPDGSALQVTLAKQSLPSPLHYTPLFLPPQSIPNYFSHSREGRDIHRGFQLVLHRCAKRHRLDSRFSRG